MHLNAAGSAAYGFSTVAVDGSIPSALSAVIGGVPNGCYWYDATHVFYQNFTNSAAPVCQIYNVSTHAISTVLPGGAPSGAGSSVAAKWSPSTGVTTTVGGLGPFASAGLEDVSPAGEIAVVTTRATGSGLVVYSQTGTTLLSLPSVVLAGGVTAVRNSIIAYQDTKGWHLQNVVTGAKPLWFPRIDGVSNVVPVLVGGVLYVVEASNSQLTIRPANTSKGFVLESTPIFFNPDAVDMSGGVCRVGYCANQGESVTSLIETDVTVATGANTRGIVSGGTIVRTPGTKFSSVKFTVGPQEGSDLTVSGYPPFTTPLVDPKTGLMTKDWILYFQTNNQSISTVSAFAGGLPTPSAPSASFSTIAPTGQTPLTALGPDSILALTSPDSSVAFATDLVADSLATSTAARGTYARILMMTSLRA